MRFFQFIYNALGIDSLEIPTIWANRKLMSTANEESDKEKLLAQLYSTVPRSTLIQVYKKYKFDYEMFGFDFDKVLSLAGYQNLTEHEKNSSPIFYSSGSKHKLIYT